MKLNLVRSLYRGDREGWARLSLFEIVEGDEYTPPPANAVNVVWYEAMEEIEGRWSAAPDVVEKVTTEVARRLDMTEARVRELRYWPEHDDWVREVYHAASEAGVEVASQGSGVPGYAYAHEPMIECWTGQWPSGVKVKYLTIEQHGGLDI